ncbi:hypothetical protein F0562_007538 [Nyssa sinensis]|uniref:Ionotropic glutamate receptor C-terminal domain-containing protein n=1 Tax=Nyssa sinensis TaxID=561372 RepID=A0A5J5A482_9ASTE|nr:hypothetical protein F0562_007538 [Nyssa sinensis]
MQGVLGVKPHVPRTKEHENFRVRWKRKFQQDNPTELNAELNIFGLWAYDAATALAMAIEKLGATSIGGYGKTNIPGNSTDLESFGISQSGPKLLQSLLSTTFRGLSGDFHIIDGQLQSSTYQIVNVIGDTTSPPKGWMIPTNGKKLRIGVPVKDGFSEFVKTTWNSDTNTTTVAGYCIDVFDAVMAALPYVVLYEYIPFATADDHAKIAGTYDDLVYQVFLGNFNAVVGDITILANTTQEKFVSNLARFVVIIWVFVVLILPQSYTASLTSMLTVQQLQPTVTDVNELVNKGEYVGYQDGSFVQGLLKRKKFDEHKLVPYNSPEECDELLSKGSGNGGNVAAFDEIPYIKLFLGRYCSKYTMVEPTYKTDGFGFVFPKGSPLGLDVSRAVLNVTEGDTMVNIGRAWFGKQITCPDPSSLVSSNSLGVGSFWGLFLIAGVASFSALLISTALFLYEHRHVLSRFDPNVSIWRKFVVMARHFDQKDLSSHSFKKSEWRGTSMHAVEPSPNITNCPPPSTSSFALHASPNTNGPSSPSSFSNHSDANFFRDQQATLSPPPNGQTPQEIVPPIELSNPNQDGPGALEFVDENP